MPRTARERAQGGDHQAEILQAGRQHLATEGAAGLSLRAIARELGMASSAVYRYVASRDELLTRLIIDAYNSLGAAAEAASRGGPRRPGWPVVGDLHGPSRHGPWRNPNECALIYGSPVPGYAAPPTRSRQPAGYRTCSSRSWPSRPRAGSPAAPRQAAGSAPACRKALAPLRAACRQA